MEDPRKITPYFTIHDADAFIDFMAATCEAKVIKLARYDDGKVHYARLKIDDSIIMSNEASNLSRKFFSNAHLCPFGAANL